MRLIQSPADPGIIEFTESYFPIVTERGGWKGVYQTFGAISNDGMLQAGLVLSDYNVFEVDLNLACHRVGAITPKMAGYVFTWIFAQGFKRITAKVAKKNKRSRKITEGMGFRLEGTLKYALDGTQDMCVYGMTFDNCKWLKNGKLPITTRS